MSDRKWGKSLWKLVLPFVLLVFVFVLLILFALARTSPCQQSLFLLARFWRSREDSLTQKKMTKALFATRELAFCIGEKERVALQYYCLLPPLWWKRCVFLFCFCFFFCFLFCFCIMFFFLSIVAFLPITLQFFFHSACNVTTYQPSNSLRKSGKQVTALARVQAWKSNWRESGQLVARENSRHFATLTFIPREKTSEKREKKFHTDDRLLVIGWSEFSRRQRRSIRSTTRIWGSDKSSVVQWCRREMSAVFAG